MNALITFLFSISLLSFTSAAQASPTDMADLNWVPGGVYHVSNAEAANLSSTDDAPYPVDLTVNMSQDPGFAFVQNSQFVMVTRVNHEGLDCLQLEESPQFVMAPITGANGNYRLRKKSVIHVCVETAAPGYVLIRPKPDQPNQFEKVRVKVENLGIASETYSRDLVPAELNGQYSTFRAIGPAPIQAESEEASARFQSTLASFRINESGTEVYVRGHFAKVQTQLLNGRQVRYFTNEDVDYILLTTPLKNVMLLTQPLHCDAELVCDEMRLAEKVTPTHYRAQYFRFTRKLLREFPTEGALLEDFILPNRFYDIHYWNGEPGDRVDRKIIFNSDFTQAYDPRQGLMHPVIPATWKQRKCWSVPEMNLLFCQSFFQDQPLFIETNNEPAYIGLIDGPTPIFPTELAQPIPNGIYGQSERGKHGGLSIRFNQDLSQVALTTDSVPQTLYPVQWRYKSGKKCLILNDARIYTNDLLCLTYNPAVLQTLSENEPDAQNVFHFMETATTEFPSYRTGAFVADKIYQAAGDDRRIQFSHDFRLARIHSDDEDRQVPIVKSFKLDRECYSEQNPRDRYGSRNYYCQSTQSGELILLSTQDNEEQESDFNLRTWKIQPEVTTPVGDTLVSFLIANGVYHFKTADHATHTLRFNADLSQVIDENGSLFAAWGSYHSGGDPVEVLHFHRFGSVIDIEVRSKKIHINTSAFTTSEFTSEEDGELIFDQVVADPYPVYPDRWIRKEGRYRGKYMLQFNDDLTKVVIEGPGLFEGFNLVPEVNDGQKCLRIQAGTDRQMEVCQTVDEQKLLLLEWSDSGEVKRSVLKLRHSQRQPSSISDEMQIDIKVQDSALIGTWKSPCTRRPVDRDSSALHTQIEVTFTATRFTWNVYEYPGDCQGLTRQLSLTDEGEYKIVTETADAVTFEWFDTKLVETFKLISPTRAQWRDTRLFWPVGNDHPASLIWTKGAAPVSALLGSWQSPCNLIPDADDAATAHAQVEVTFTETKFVWNVYIYPNLCEGKTRSVRTHREGPYYPLSESTESIQFKWQEAGYIENFILKGPMSAQWKTTRLFQSGEANPSPLTWKRIR